MSAITLAVEQINAMNPLDIVKDDRVRQRFIQIYDALWGAGEGEAAYERESIYFNQILSDNEKLRKVVSKFSIFTAFIDLAVCGLSLIPGSRALCYLQGRNVKIGENNGRAVYEGRLTVTISGYGELVLRARSGQIRHADNPVLVYEEDDFSFSDRDGRKSVDYTCRIPHKTNHIVAAFIRITRADGSIDYSVMFEEDWLRLKDYSSKNNKKWDDASRRYVAGAPNELYTSNGGGIDTGFLSAKCIKHAFKSYPKVRIGRGTELETQQPDTCDEDYYGTSADEPAAASDPAPAFGNAPDPSAGVRVDPSESQQSGDDDGAF